LVEKVEYGQFPGAIPGEDIQVVQTHQREDLESFQHTGFKAMLRVEWQISRLSPIGLGLLTSGLQKMTLAGTGVSPQVEVGVEFAS
jgi:hypothetical protein